MSRLRLITAGESHGRGILGIMEGFPAGHKIDFEILRNELALRRGGYGRSGRMKIEEDTVEFISGVRGGFTTGNPISFYVENKEWDKWADYMSPEGEVKKGKEVSVPRPGHADLAGAMKFLKRDMRDVLERASARGTVAYTVAGAICKSFLKEMGILSFFQVLSIGGVKGKKGDYPDSYEEFYDIISRTMFYSFDESAEEEMKKEVDMAMDGGYSLGGVFEVCVKNVPPGLGSYTQWDRKMDGILAGALMSIPAVKAVEIGEGIRGAYAKGYEFHDEIFYKDKDSESVSSYRDVKCFYRKTNNAGGIEGGVSNGEDIVIRCYMKPIPTMRKPMRSVDVISKKEAEAHFERADVCAVPSAAVIGSAVVSIHITSLFLEKFGGDSISECRSNYLNYLYELRKL